MKTPFGRGCEGVKIDGMRNLNLSKSAEQVEKGEILLEKEVCDFLNDRESGSQSDGGKGF